MTEWVRGVFVGIMEFVLEYHPQRIDVWSLKVSLLCVIIVQPLQLYHVTLLLIRGTLFGVPLLMVTYLENVSARLVAPLFTSVLTFFQFHMVEWELVLFQSKLFNSYGHSSAIESVALKAAMVMLALLLQRPFWKSKPSR